MESNFDFSSFPDLETERLYLRKLTSTDASILNELLSSEEVLLFSNRPPFNSIEKAKKLIEKFDNSFRNKTAIQWAITLKSDKSFIGNCGSYEYDRDCQKIDIGYLLLPEYWGYGYATEATRAMIYWNFEVLGVHRIQADCTSGHVASENVLFKCGFKEEGIWRESCWEHGKFVDIKQFGLLRQEYDQQT